MFTGYEVLYLVPTTFMALAVSQFARIMCSVHRPELGMLFVHHNTKAVHLCSSDNSHYARDISNLVII